MAGSTTAGARHAAHPAERQDADEGDHAARSAAGRRLAAHRSRWRRMRASRSERSAAGVAPGRERARTRTRGRRRRRAANHVPVHVRHQVAEQGVVDLARVERELKGSRHVAHLVHESPTLIRLELEELRRVPPEHEDRPAREELVVVEVDDALVQRRDPVGRIGPPAAARRAGRGRVGGSGRGHAQSGGRRRCQSVACWYACATPRSRPSDQ